MIAAAELQALSDSDLDTAYAAYFDVKDTATYTQLGSEIVNRLTSVFSFVQGVFGGTRFPLWEARQAYFKQTVAAQSSVANSAANVAGTAKDYMLGIGVPLVATAVIVLYLIYANRK